MGCPWTTSVSLFWVQKRDREGREQWEVLVHLPNYHMVTIFWTYVWICNGVWHSWKFRHNQISEYIRITQFTRTNVKIYLCKKMYEYLNIFKYLSNVYTLTHSQTSEYIRRNKFDTNKCPNIFVQEKIDTTECPNKYLLPIYSNIWIYWSNSALCNQSWTERNVHKKYSGLLAKTLMRSFGLCLHTYWRRLILIRAKRYSPVYQNCSNSTL